MTKATLRKRIKGIRGDQRRRVVCALVGHSRVIVMCAGYIYCARCDAQIGDRLLGSFDLNEHVIVDHNCKECRKNSKALTWEDFESLPSEARRGIPG